MDRLSISPRSLQNLNTIAGYGSYMGMAVDAMSRALDVSFQMPDKVSTGLHDRLGLQNIINPGLIG